LPVRPKLSASSERMVITMNLPNKLTTARLIIVPFFLVVMLTRDYVGYHYLLALVLFIGASLTDHYDGKIARERNQITNFGKFMDPLADKILVISALVCFLQFGLTDAWAVILIIFREFMVTAIRLVAAENGEVLAANKWGKTKTVSQIAAIIVVLLFQFIQELVEKGVVPAFSIGGASSAYAFMYIGNVLIWISVFFTLLSGIIYLKENIGLINTTK
jgi:CDP-diacylglycerol---glycerol-3-phosphate 3-phosphatidyltransferase